MLAKRRQIIMKDANETANTELFYIEASFYIGGVYIRQIFLLRSFAKLPHLLF